MSREMPNLIWAMKDSAYGGDVWYEGNKINPDDIAYVPKSLADELCVMLGRIKEHGLRPDMWGDLDKAIDNYRKATESKPDGQ